MEKDKWQRIVIARKEPRSCGTTTKQSGLLRRSLRSLLAMTTHTVIASDPPAGGERSNPVLMKAKNYYVYIMANKGNSVLYTGVTNNLERRIYEHKTKSIKGFSEKYNINKLVYCEQYNSAYDAISREKQIKGGSRKKKVTLIEKDNPDWKDLSLNIV